MKRVVNKLLNSKYEVVCDLDEKVWKEAQEKAFAKLAKNLKLDGFRPGKVPLEMAKKHIPQADVFNEAINSILQPTFDEVLKEEKILPVARPSVDVTKVSDKELQVKFLIITAPDVTLGKYKGHNVEEVKPEVSKEELDEAIKRLVEQNATLTSVDRVSKLGDTVVIDFLGSVNGVPFDGGKAENYSLELGSHQFIPGFEEQLVGKKSGEKVEVKVTFPKQYVAELAGKDAVFAVTIHEVKEKVIPELNEELIKDLNIEGVKSVEELREHEKAHLLEHKKEHARAETLNKIVDKILAETKVEIVDEIINDEVEGMRKQMSDRMAQQGLTLEHYLELTGQSNDDFNKTLRVDAEKNLKVMFVMEAIAKAENIVVGDKEVDEEISKIAKQYNTEEGKVKEILAANLANFKAELRQRKLQDFIFDNNVKKSSSKKSEEKPAEEKKAPAKKPAAKKPAAKK